MSVDAITRVLISQIENASEKIIFEGPTMYNTESLRLFLGVPA